MSTKNIKICDITNKSVSSVSPVNAAAQIFSFENLLKCYYECRKRKRFTANALQFEINFEKELLKLQKELKSHTYTPGRSICFVVTKPKYREIRRLHIPERSEGYGADDFRATACGEFQKSFLIFFGIIK